MKRIKKLVLMIMGVTLIIACNSNHQKSDIELNNGEKWEVNDEMKPHIEKGNAILDEFISQNSEYYQKLAENLTTQNNQLIKSCTMKGESHDELHKWLHPHMKLVEELSSAKDFNNAKKIISKLESSFNTYHNYFQ